LDSRGAANPRSTVVNGPRLTDEATCYKAFPTALLRAMKLHCERFEFCPEVTAKACRLGLTIHEVPISYDARSVQAGKKIRFRDGLAALAALWRWRKWRGSRNSGPCQPACLGRAEGSETRCAGR
jgi:dolichol-phosphate mannosyltransferase